MGVEELIERQEKSLTQLESKRGIVKDLIIKGKQLLENPDKPKFLDSHVKRIEDGWDETKEKASTRLQLLSNTKGAWEGYADGLETIAVKFDKAEEEIKKIKKRFNLQAAFEDLEKRQKILNDTKNGINGLHGSINNNFDIMTMTLPEDKKDFVKKEIKAVTEKLTVLDRFDEKVKKIESWMKDAENQLHEIKNNSDKMTPEDRVSYTMDLREDIAAKVDIITKNLQIEQELLPQGDSVPKDAQDYKDELLRIKKYVDDLYARCAKECDNFSEDVKYWAQYKTGIKEFGPWLTNAEQRSHEGLSKPQTLDEANAMHATVMAFDKGCLTHLNILEQAAAA